MSGAGGRAGGVLRRFFREHLRRYLALQVEIGFCLLVGVALELADPLILKAVIDRALGDGDRALLLALGGLLVAVIVFRIAFRVLSVYLYSYSGLRVLFDFRQRAFEHVQRLSPYYFRAERQGDILARLTADVDVLQRAAAHTLVNGVHDLLVLGGIFGVLLWIDPALTLALALAYPLLALVLARTNRHLRSESLTVRAAIGALYTFLDERLGGVRLVQEFRRQKTQAREHVRVSRPWIRSNLRLSIFGAAQVSLADAMTAGAFLVVFVLGGLRAMDGTLSLGSLVAFYTLATRLYRPIAGLIDINIDLQVARASLQRVYELLDLEPDVREPEHPREPRAVAGALRVEGLTHRWGEGAPVLSDVDLRVAPGEALALVGPSGSGKSTLAAMLARFVDPAEGRVLVDGVDARELRLATLRRTVGLVTQETQLFHDTIAANLRLAAPRATEAELLSALDAVELGAFVRGLDEGLDTLVGEQGLRLSGGERQRLALARALLKDPAVLILDEATSALDEATERAVLARLMAGGERRTLVVITHRLASLRRADRVVVLKAGRVVQEGSPAEVLARDVRCGELPYAAEQPASEPVAPPARAAQAPPLEG